MAPKEMGPATNGAQHLPDNNSPIEFAAVSEESSPALTSPSMVFDVDLGMLVPISGVSFPVEPETVLGPTSTDQGDPLATAITAAIVRVTGRFNASMYAPMGGRRPKVRAPGPIPWSKLFKTRYKPMRGIHAPYRGKSTSMPKPARPSTVTVFAETISLENIRTLTKAWQTMRKSCKTRMLALENDHTPVSVQEAAITLQYIHVLTRGLLALRKMAKRKLSGLDYDDTGDRDMATCLETYNSILILAHKLGALTGNEELTNL